MVQLTDVTGGQAEITPPVSYSQAYSVTSLDQLPHTSLAQQPVSCHISSSSPTAHSFPDSCPETGYDLTSSHDAFVPSPSDAFLSTDPNLSPNTRYSTVHCHSFTTFGPIDTIPSTVLSSDINTAVSFESQEMPTDLSNDGGKTFEVLPVTESSSYVTVDNAHGNQSFFVDNKLLKDTHADSVDSLVESKGYSSDCSDVYMNSDYTDTVTSADSAAFLLPVKDSVHNYSHTDNSNDHFVEESVPVSYSNEAFSTDSKKETLTWSSDDSDCEKLEEKSTENTSNETKHWIITIPEEDSGMMADKEDDEEEDREDKEFISLAENSTLENLVNHLAEQHPVEVVDITVQVLDGPVYEPLTEPLEEPLEEERSWLQSTDSLHHYKLLKQGRSTTMDSLRVQAISNLRANTMNNLHERSSFLNLTANSVSNLGNACQKALSYVRADMEFGSMMSLRNNAFSSSLLPGREQPPQDLESFSSGKKMGQPTVASGCHTRNLLYMALLVTILLVSVNTTRNLQSSLNQEGGVGIICLAVMFASYMLGSLLSPVLVQGQGVKVCIIAGLVLQLLYVGANMYPVLWLMLPASLGGGASLALIWNAMSTYVVLLARGESDYKQKSYQRTSDKYFGIFCLIYQSNLIVGNLIASLVLTFGGGEDSGTPIHLNSTNVSSLSVNMSTSYMDLATTALPPLQEVVTDVLNKMAVGDTNNNSSVGALPFDATTESHYHLCGAEYCHHFIINQESSAVPEHTIYLLFGIFIFLVGIAILIAIFLLEPLSPRPFSSTATPWHTVKCQLLSLAKFSCNGKFLLMLPLLLYGTMQFSFVCSEVMMAYVTCPVGVWMVGYTMIAYGVCCSLASYIAQALVPVTGRGFLIGLATAMNVGLLAFMRVWQPHPDSVLPLFVITSLLGWTDGIWNVNANGLCGSVFPDHYEEAFTGLRMAQGLGGAFSMVYAPFFCMAFKLYIMIGAAVVVFAGYIGAEFLIRRDQREKDQFMYEKEIV